MVVREGRSEETTEVREVGPGVAAGKGRGNSMGKDPEARMPCGFKAVQRPCGWRGMSKVGREAAGIRACM